jgi:hypothetical protein
LADEFLVTLISKKTSPQRRKQFSLVVFVMVKEMVTKM